MSLQISGVRHAFGANTVLRDVDFTVQRGHLAAILGRSGCGKTTLLRIIAGLTRPDQGSVVLAGRDLTGIPAQHRRIALVPQEGALFPHLSVAGNVGFAVRGRHRQSRIAEMLELVGLQDLGDRMPHEISGGQAQRVALARALAVQPDLVLLDEPFSALDAATRTAMRSDVRRVLHDAGASAILVTHDREEALSLADHLILMADGRVIQDGPPSDVYDHPVSPQAALLAGDAFMIHATARGMAADTSVGRIPLGVSAHGEGMVLVRPEQITLDPEGAVSARVRDVTFYGHDADVQLHGLPGGIEMVARVQRATCAPGDEVRIRVSHAALFCAA
ncbi:ABC transporter ATP-binding protein [Tessaracoccus sp. MC1679]|uniref:ABC transporter ATP-binding protein n=1 Tax=Tessaracoccus sp. MC1679 TaxID=2760313 RepID=UPI0015FF0429|nr:ABC transporter ATP-binding protein [Tessaracoccus sp. MC1679]MBB1516455.1 ABC transporter ATP-binding protein [Tessaracoccus sp. MC1679]